MNVPAVGVLQVVLDPRDGWDRASGGAALPALREPLSAGGVHPGRAGAWAAELEASGIEIIPLDRRPGFRPELGWRIARAARLRGTKVIHSHHYSPFVYGLIATLVHPDLRLVFTEHGRLSDGPPSPKRKIVNPVLGRLRGEHFAVSQALKESMAARRVSFVTDHCRA